MSSAASDLQHVHTRARQQRAVDLERRILGGRADEDQRAVLDERQERVLLRLVEAMHLVEEQHGAAPVLLARRDCACSTAARMSLTPAMHGRERDELRIAGLRDEARQRGLAGARRSPQDHRVQRLPSSMRRSGLPGASRCRCPTNSLAGVAGRMRSASGAARCRLTSRSPAAVVLCPQRPVRSKREQQAQQMPELFARRSA